MSVTTHHRARAADEGAAARIIRVLAAALARGAVTGIPPCVLWPAPFVPMDDR